MRLMLAPVFAMGFLVGGCAIPKPEANPDKYADYRSDTELLERMAGLDVATEAYVQQQAKNDGPLIGRQKLGTLKDEMGANELREKQQIERVLAERYRNGDKKAYFEGIEKVPLN